MAMMRLGILIKMDVILKFNMTRKLASIQKILDVHPIPNADAIEVVTINGWKVVAKKDEFKIGDLCVYFEIDSFLPIKPEFEFLRKACYRKMADDKEGFRLRTIKLRGQISQGLALPIATFFKAPYLISANYDITEYLGVIKYEMPIPPALQGFAKGNFPSFIRKTDQERVQNIWSELKEKYNEIDFEISLKLDGTSATYFYRDGEIGVCSRNLNLKIEDEDLVDKGVASIRSKNTYISCGVRDGIFEGLKKLERNIAIQGEIIGEGIQGNPEKLIGQHLHIFDIYDIDQSRYLIHKERMEILREFELTRLNLIRILSFRSLHCFQAIDDILQFAEGKSINAEIREGLVFKSTELVNGEVLSFKVISNQFLLNEK